MLDGEVQFPAQRADEIDAQCVDVPGVTGLDHLARQPRKRRVIERHVDDFRQQLARSGAGDDEATAAAGNVSQSDRAITRQHALQVSESYRSAAPALMT